MLEDNGCPIVIRNTSVKLDNFISDVLTIFLSGRVFDETFEVGKLTTSNHKSSGNANVINYAGFGKNIILPYFREEPLDEDLSFIPIGNEYVYYNYMVENDQSSIEKYTRCFAKELYDEGKSLFDINYRKYVFK